MVKGGNWNVLGSDGLLKVTFSLFRSIVRLSVLTLFEVQCGNVDGMAKNINKSKMDETIP
jgi:hypothetical protein